MEIIYGKNAILEFLKSEQKPVKLYLETSLKGSLFYKELEEASPAGLIPCFVLRDKLTEIAGTNKHQGAVLLAEPFRYANLEVLLKCLNMKGRNILLMLDGVTDPQNLGAVLRSAEAAAVKAVIIRKDRSAGVTSAVYKTSAGALAYVPLAQVKNLTESLKIIKKAGFWAVGLESGSGTEIYDYDFDRNTVLVLGSEGKGISELLKKNCDVLVSIPMSGKINSLNVSAAAAVALFEIGVRPR